MLVSYPILVLACLVCGGQDETQQGVAQKDNGSHFMAGNAEIDGSMDEWKASSSIFKDDAGDMDASRGSDILGITGMFNGETIFLRLDFARPPRKNQTWQSPLYLAMSVFGPDVSRPLSSARLDFNADSLLVTSRRDSFRSQKQLEDAGVYLAFSEDGRSVEISFPAATLLPAELAKGQSIGECSVLIDTFPDRLPRPDDQWGPEPVPLRKANK